MQDDGGQPRATTELHADTVDRFAECRDDTMGAVGPNIV